MWNWHGKEYLGAAHGVAGILYLLLQVRLVDSVVRGHFRIYRVEGEFEVGGYLHTNLIFESGISDLFCWYR